MRGFFMTGSAALALTVTTALTFAAQPAAAVELRIATSTSVFSADPHFANPPSNYGIHTGVYDPLVRLRDKDSVPEPWLAESWRLINDTTWEFRIRPGVKFHDGSPFTAHDAAFSYQRAKTLNASPLSFAQDLRKIKEMTVPDDLTLRVVTDGPAPALLDAIGLVHMVSKKAAENARPEDFNNGKAAIGTGPYKFVSWTVNDKYVANRNADYWRGPVEFEKLTITVMPNAAARSAALLSGDIDVEDAVPPQDIDRLAKDSRVNMVSVITSRLCIIGLDVGEEALQSGNLTGPNGEKLDKNPFADARVREAMKLAIDLDGIAKKVHDGRAMHTGQFFMPQAFSYNPAFKSWALDEARAKALLADSGWAGKFKITLGVGGDYFPNAVNSAQALAQAWTRVGIPTTVNNTPYPVFIENRNQRKLPVVFSNMNLVGDKAEIPLTQFLHTRQLDRGFGALNFARYSNPEVDKLVEASFMTLDEKVQKDTRNAAAKMILADNVVIPTWFVVGATALRKGLEYSPRTDGIFSPANVTVSKSDVATKK